MKPLLTEDRDGVRLQDLGRASLQIIHDIKNQLNGLKLYATYLRKRIEKSEEQGDLQETVTKLIDGVDRAASDLNMLVQYGRPIVLNKLKGTDLQKILRGMATNWPESGGESVCALNVDSDSPSLIGEFDAPALTDAINAVSTGALKASGRDGAPVISVSLRRQVQGRIPSVVVEWSPVRFPNGDPFKSFHGTEAIRMSLAAKIVEAHGGSIEYQDNSVRLRLPLSEQ